jgi:hypothetical protein
MRACMGRLLAASRIIISYCKLLYFIFFIEIDVLCLWLAANDDSNVFLKARQEHCGSKIAFLSLCPASCHFSAEVQNGA